MLANDFVGHRRATRRSVERGRAREADRRAPQHPARGLRRSASRAPPANRSRPTSSRQKSVVADVSELDPIIDRRPRRERRPGRRVPRRQGGPARVLRRPGDEGVGRQGRPAGRGRAAQGEARRMRRAAAFCAVVACALAPGAGARGHGSFETSDCPAQQDLGRRRSRPRTTASRSRSRHLDPRDCQIYLPLVILDGPVRDRCPYIGDLAVTGMTLLVSGGRRADAADDDLRGSRRCRTRTARSPRARSSNHTPLLIDYNAYWIETLYDYTLYTGDRSLLKKRLPEPRAPRRRPLPGPRRRERAARELAARGTTTPTSRRTGPTSRTTTRSTRGRSAWPRRSRSGTGSPRSPSPGAPGPPRSSTQFSSSFWDPAAGAFTDSAGDTTVHPQDGNVFAILAGLATAPQARVGARVHRPDDVAPGRRHDRRLERLGQRRLGLRRERADLPVHLVLRRARALRRRRRRRRRST